MGCQARAVKKYVKEYADSYSFNWSSEAVYDYLTYNDVEIWLSNENDTTSNWQISLDDDTFKNLIEQIKQLPPDENHAELKEWTNGYVVEAFETWLACARRGVIRIEWF